MSLSSTSSSSASVVCSEAPSASQPTRSYERLAEPPTTSGYKSSATGPSARATTLRLRGFRPWGAVFAVVLLIVAECAVRWFLPDIPTQGIFASHRIQQKVTELEEIVDPLPIDVLFIGTSLVDVGIDPVLFDELLEEQGTQVVSYNLGIQGPTMEGVHAVLGRFFLPKIKPRLVYICVSPNGLNGTRIPYVDEISKPFVAMAQVSTFEEVFGRTLHKLRLYACRGDLSEWLKSGGTAEFGGSNRQYGQSRGFHAREGVMVNDSDFAYRLGGFVPGERDVAALAALCRWCTESGAEYIIVDMPLTNRCRQVSSAKERTSYLAVLQQASLPGVPVLSFSIENFADQYFYDGVHLNVEGAARMTGFLASDATNRLCLAPRK